MTLMELLVSLAIMMLVAAVLAPSLDAALMLEQRGAARRLAMAFEQLHDEAILRNKTYRVALNLDTNSWKIEVGEPGVVVFESEEARMSFEKRARALLDRMEPEERAAYEREHATFGALSDDDIAADVTFPESLKFKSVFTPQYPEPLKPTAQAGSKQKRLQEDDDGNPLQAIAYSYIFSNGSSEHTVIQLVDTEDEDIGFTITVDPLSGRVLFHDELVDQEDMWSFLPDRGPRLELR